MSFFSRQPAPQTDSIPADTALAPNALIGLRNLEKSYAHGTSRTYVLRRINVDVKEGEFISIMGPSGAGKSTLLHIIGMHDSAWTGDYYFLDQPVHKLAAKDRAKLHKQYIGFVFQSYHLLDHLTVYENLDIPLSYRDIKKSERESMVCARRHLEPEGDSGRRANRQPAHESGPGDHGALPKAERDGDDDHPGDPLGGQRGLRKPDHSAA